MEAFLIAYIKNLSPDNCKACLAATYPIVMVRARHPIIVVRARHALQRHKPYPLPIAIYAY